MAYIKQDWNNLPNTTTPINSERMEHIENGIYANDTDKLDKKSVKTSKTTSDTDTYSCNYIESLKGEILYESAGDVGNITLNKTNISDYKYLEIFFHADGIYNSIKIENANNRNFCINLIYTASNTGYQYFFTSGYKINGNILQFDYATNSYMRENNWYTYNHNSYVRIYKVIGYK